MNVAGQLQQIVVLIDKNATIAPLEEMSDPIMSSIKIVRICSIQIVQRGSQVSTRGSKKQMVMLDMRT